MSHVTASASGVARPAPVTTIDDAVDRSAVEAAIATAIPERDEFRFVNVIGAFT